MKLRAQPAAGTPESVIGGFDPASCIPLRKFGDGDNAVNTQVRPSDRGRLVNDDGAAGPLPAAFIDHRPHS
ncbi:hypothetical protein EAO68_37705 [Streptomyces sp. wa22]|nr:hypothetical protein EAO68_37705 [Streptomyces sp. wa22]